MRTQVAPARPRPETVGFSRFTFTSQSALLAEEDLDRINSSGQNLRSWCWQAED